MAGIPTGTVTFLFTDIQGSTKLAREHHETWEFARARHHEILRGAIESYQGYVFQIIGDAFCAAFHTAADALKASIKAQQTLQIETWGETTIGVRMGIHTGEAQSDGDGYRGYLTMSLVQRLMSAGHGGQILLSDATEKLLREEFSDTTQLRDLGEHKFKDVPYPIRIFQAVTLGLQSEFPALHTLDTHPNNLPTQLTSFVGREKELEDVKRLLQNAHLLTLIGPGGTGKTRLSIQAASEMLDIYPDGMWLVELAPILDPLLVPRTTAIAIGLREEPQRPVIDMLCDYLHEKKMLIVLDNCEHLVDACALMADRILHAAPNTRILASSREALGVGGEVTYRVPSLAVPDPSHLPPIESLDQYEAVKLFIDRAMSAVPSFMVTNENAPFLAQICQRLDGIPLAIELAAAKVRALNLDQIAKRLDDRFRLLTGGNRTALERHQTLRAAIDWSYNLLPPAEQTLFRRLSIFVNGWTLEAAESVCSDNSINRKEVLHLLEHLINKSIVILEGTRYQLLETLRQYANEKLVEAGESDLLRDRHLEYFLNLVETAEPHLIRPEQLEWLRMLNADYENIRLALEWALGKVAAEPSLKLCSSLGWFWKTQCFWLEGLNWVKRALTKSSLHESIHEKATRARALNTCADCEWQLGNFDQMLSCAQASLALALEVSSRKDIAIAKFYIGIGLRSFDEGEALSMMEESFTEFQALDDAFWQTFSFPYVDEFLQMQGKLKKGEAIQTGLELARKTGERLTLADALSTQAGWLFRVNRVDEAKEAAEESDRLYKEIGSYAASLNAFLFASIAWLAGDYQTARSFLIERRVGFDLLGEKPFKSLFTGELGLLEMDAGDLNQAQIYLEEALAFWHQVGFKYHIACRLIDLSKLFYLQGHLEKYKEKFKEGLSLKNDIEEQSKAYISATVLDTLYSQKPETSACLLGVIDAYQTSALWPLRPLETRYCHVAETHCRQTLGDAAFRSAFAEGEKMSLDKALDLALKTVEEM